MLPKVLSILTGYRMKDPLVIDQYASVFCLALGIRVLKFSVLEDAHMPMKKKLSEKNSEKK